MIAKSKLLLFILLSFFSIFALAKEGKEIYHRNFWQPVYHGERLAYCSLDGKYCGMELATRYCRLMGYLRADHAVKAHNIGLTHYLLTLQSCKGWRCDGFKTIRCVGNFALVPPESYHYRHRRFVLPRYNNYRVAWCYDGKKGCGRRAAYSFCRRLGYLKVQRYKMAASVLATQAIGNQELCFGPQCNGFAMIDCYR